MSHTQMMFLLLASATAFTAMKDRRVRVPAVGRCAGQVVGPGRPDGLAASR